MLSSACRSTIQSNAPRRGQLTVKESFTALTLRGSTSLMYCCHATQSLPTAEYIHPTCTRIRAFLICSHAIKHETSAWMPPSTRSVTPTPLVLTPAVTPPQQAHAPGFGNGHANDELDLSGELPSRSYLDTTNDGFHTPVGVNSISPAQSPVHSKAPLTEASATEYQTEHAEVGDRCPGTRTCIR